MNTLHGLTGSSATRMLIGLIWIGGALFNALWTLRHTSMFRDDLGEDATFGIYRWFFDSVVGPAPFFWTVLLILGEIGLGVLLLGKGRWARYGLIGSAIWSLFLSFVTFPYTAMMPLFVLLSGGLLRYDHDTSLFDVFPRRHSGLRMTGKGA